MEKNEQEKNELHISSEREQMKNNIKKGFKITKR